MSDCAFLARAGIELHQIDMSPASQDHRDNRIRAAVIVDPGIVETLTHKSLQDIDNSTLMINLGEEASVPIGVYARPAAKLIKSADFQIAPGAIHFCFLAECKAKGSAILVREGEPDPLCDDAGGRSRGAINAELENLIAGYLNRVFEGAVEKSWASIFGRR